MNFKHPLIIAVLSAASSVALAGSFDGPFVQLGAGGSATSSKVSNDDTYASVNGTTNGSSFNGLVSAGWSQEIADSGFNLAANMFYVIGDQKAGQKNASYANSTGFWQRQSLDTKLQNTFGISVEPGWNFSSETLGYAKLAWVNTRMNFNSSYADSYSTNNANETHQATVNGFGYGLGAKHLFTKNIYGAVDLMGVSYKSYTTPAGASIRPTQFMGFASIGYKF